MTRVMDLNPHSFGWEQIVAANKVYELDVWLLEKLAERYLTSMENFGILERVPKEKSCYDILQGETLTLLPSGYHAPSRTFTARNSTRYELTWDDGEVRRFPQRSASRISIC